MSPSTERCATTAADVRHEQVARTQPDVRVALAKRLQRADVRLRVEHPLGDELRTRLAMVPPRDALTDSGSAARSELRSRAGESTLFHIVLRPTIAAERAR